MTVLRIIDANANRAREALRVMEEAARFVLEDAGLTGELKRCRHRLAGALAPFDALEFHRDTPGDVGTEISLETERDRASVADVVTAAGKRLGEALRAIEEYAKTVDPAVAAAVERLRYETYTLGRRLDVALGAGRARQWRVCVLFSEAQCGSRPWREVAESVWAAVPDCIQIREKGLDDRALLRRVRLFVEGAPRTTIIVNDRPDIADLAGAHGVHLGQGDLPCADVRRLVGRRLLVGVSTSRIEEAHAALRDGADYCGVGPMFPSETKPKTTIAGPAYLREYLAWNRLPHLAISGITTENVAGIVAAGVRGVAVSRAVCAAADPGAVVRALTRAMDGAARPLPV